MGNSNSRMQRTVGIDSHPYQKNHPYVFDDLQNDESYDSEQEMVTDDEYLEPTRLHKVFSKDAHRNTHELNISQKKGRRRIGEVFEPNLFHGHSRLSHGSSSYISLDHDESRDDHMNSISEHHGHSNQNHRASLSKKASKRTLLTALKNKMSQEQARGIENKGSSDSAESQASTVSLRQYILNSNQQSGSHQSALETSVHFRSFGKQLSTILDESEFNKSLGTTHPNETNMEDSCILSDIDRTYFNDDKVDKLYGSKEEVMPSSPSSEGPNLGINMTDYTDRMNSFLDKNHASYDQNHKSVMDLKTPTVRLADFFADMTLDQSCKFIVMEESGSNLKKTMDDSSNGTWSEFQDSTIRNSPEFVNHSTTSSVSTHVQAHIQRKESQSAEEEHLQDIFKEFAHDELSSIPSNSNVDEEERFDLSIITESEGNDYEVSAGSLGKSQEGKKSEDRKASPIPIHGITKAPTSSNDTNLLPSMSITDTKSEIEDAPPLQKDKTLNCSEAVKGSDHNHISQFSGFKNVAIEIGQYIQIEDDMTQVSAITTAPILNACAVIQNHSSPAYSKQVLQNAAFLFSDQSAPNNQIRAISKIDQQRLAVMNIRNENEFGEIMLPNENPLDMIKRLSQGRSEMRMSTASFQTSFKNGRSSISILKSKPQYEVLGNDSSIIPPKSTGEPSIVQNIEPRKESKRNNEQSCVDSLADILDDETASIDFQQRYSAITPMKTKSPYIRFKKAMQLFGGQLSSMQCTKSESIGKQNVRSQCDKGRIFSPNSGSTEVTNTYHFGNDDAHDEVRLKSPCNFSSEDTYPHTFEDTLNPNHNDDMDSQVEASVTSHGESLSFSGSTSSNVFDDILNSDSPESAKANQNPYLPHVIRSAMKHPKDVREPRINRVSWINGSKGNAFEIFRSDGVLQRQSSPLPENSITDSASIMTMTPPSIPASKTKFFKSVVNPRMMFQRTDPTSKSSINNCENRTAQDEHSCESSYCSYSPLPLKSHSLSVGNDKSVPSERSELCLSPLQKPSVHSRKWRKNVDGSNNFTDKMRQRSMTKRSPLSNLRNTSYV